MAGQYEQYAGPSPTGGARALEQRNATPMLGTRLTQSSAVAVVRRVRVAAGGLSAQSLARIPVSNPGTHRTIHPCTAFTSTTGGRDDRFHAVRCDSPRAVGDAAGRADAGDAAGA